MVSEGCSDAQTAGRPLWPKIRQRSCSSSWTQRTPAGFPSGMPGMGLEMEGAVQQAPQPGRHSGTERVSIQVMKNAVETTKGLCYNRFD